MVTKRQLECLHAIEGWWRDFSESPTRTELGKKLGITRVSAHLLIDKLERAKLVETYPRIWRNISVM